MDIVSLIVTFVTMLGSIPVVGKVLAVAIPAIAGLAGCVTALVAIWHGFVALLVGLAKIPGLSGLAGFAEKMKNDESKVDGFLQGTLFPLLNRLSAIPVPQVKQEEAPKA
jgi:hypothetical protein